MRQCAVLHDQVKPLLTLGQSVEMIMITPSGSRQMVLVVLSLGLFKEMIYLGWAFRAIGSGDLMAEGQWVVIIN